jgi:hypothetical protein
MPEDALFHALQESNPVFEKFLPAKRITMDKISPSIHL